MNNEQGFDIDISADGNDIVVEGVGLVGPECEKLTAAIQDELGRVTKTVKKPEYHRTKPVLRKAGA